MFSVYGITGRVFSGTLEQWRRVAQVPASTGVAALRSIGQDEASPKRPPSEPEGEVQRGAIAAYRSAQQGAEQRHPLTRVGEVMSRKLITVPHEVPVAQAWRLLAQHAIGQVPVVGALR